MYFSMISVGVEYHFYKLVDNVHGNECVLFF